MRESKKVYEYSGPVIVDGQRVTWKWTARTWAVSPKKAQNNLTHRFKKENNIPNGTSVVLEGRIHELYNSALDEPIHSTSDFFSKNPQQLQLNLSI